MVAVTVSGFNDAARPPAARIPQLVSAVTPSMMRVIVLLKQEGRTVPVVNGSAFVIGPNGLVATAAHVIDGFPVESLLIVPSDVRDVIARDAGASVIAIDREHDLALLRAEAAASRPALEIEPSGGTSIGEDALLLGFPLGDPVLTVSKAMIAAKILRTATSTAPATALIKLDASVNKGNSGGPLIRVSSGKVIGVTSLKVGSIQDQLQKLLRERRTAESGDDADGPIELIKAIVADMETNLQLGLGYAVATEHLLPLLAASR